MWGYSFFSKLPDRGPPDVQADPGPGKLRSKAGNLNRSKLAARSSPYKQKIPYNMYTHRCVFTRMQSGFENIIKKTTASTSLPVI